MKRISKVLSTLLAILMVFSIIPMANIEAEAASVTLAQLQSKYPHGKYWNGGNANSYTSSPCNHHGSCSYNGSCGCNSFKGHAIQCMGFAYQLAYLVYGGDPYVDWTANRNSSALNSLKPGDVVRYKNDGHSIFVTGVSGDTVTYADCNSDGHCKIRWNQTISKSTLKSTFTYVDPAPYAWNPTPETHKVNSNYGKNFIAYPKAKITAENIFDANHNQIGSSAWIGTSDKCTIHEVYTDGCCKVTYPLDSGGTKTVYSKISLFNIHTHSYTTYYEAAHPHKIYKECSCGDWSYTGEYYTLDSCSSCRAENPKKIYASTSSVTLKLGATESTTIYVWTGGIHNNPCVLSWQTSNSNIGCSWGEWNDAGKLPLTITAKAKGSTVVTLSVKDKNSDSVLHSIKINVNVDAKTYTISYNVNGGTGAPESQTKTHGSALTLNSTKPTRTGYTFLGWSTSSTATSATYSAGGSFTINANTTLYAVWKPNTYTVKFNANGGTGTMSNQSFTYNTAKALTANSFTRTGHTFLGWSTSSSATTATYTDKQSVKNLTSTDGGTVTLYAVWKPNTYTVKFNANGGNGTMSNQSFTYNTAKALTANSFTRIGYTFLGWSTSSTATTATYTDKQSVKNLTSTNGGTVTLYAVWSKKPTYTLSYNANGGSGAPASQTGFGTFNISSTVPTRAGYTFVGWSSVYPSDIADFQPKEMIAIDANITLYAVWKPNTYTVKFNANGGTGTMSNQSFTYDAAKSLTANSFTRAGYTFVGWSKSSTATTATYTDKQSVKNLTTTNGGYVTLYAVWQKNPVTVSSISIASKPSKTEYYVGDTFSSSGLSVKVTMSDGTIKTLTSGFTVSSPDMSTAGTKTVTVTYSGKTASFTIKVVEKPVTPDVPDTNFTFSIQTPSRTEIRNKDGIILHTNIDGELPEGARVEWSWDNSKFDVEKNDDGTLTIIAENNGYTTFTATVYNADGTVLATDSIEMRSKSGFFDKIGGFFRSLFGSDKIYEY